MIYRRVSIPSLWKNLTTVKISEQCFSINLYPSAYVVFSPFNAGDLLVFFPNAFPFHLYYLIQFFRVATFYIGDRNWLKYFGFPSPNSLILFSGYMEELKNRIQEMKTEVMVIRLQKKESLINPRSFSTLPLHFSQIPLEWVESGMDLRCIEIEPPELVENLGNLLDIETLQ